MLKSKETPAQKIKRLERELKDEKLRNQILNTMIDISDQQYDASIRKSFHPNHQTHPTKARNKSFSLLLIVWDM